MQHAAETEFAVLHALRLKGLAEAPAVAVAFQLPVDDVERALKALAADDLVSRRDGRLTGWSLTGAGRARHAAALAEQAADVRDDIDCVYRRFLPANRELLQVCTDWQVRDGALNDHADADYDRAVLARLDAVDEMVQPLCAELGDVLARFRSYQPRLAHARKRVCDGDVAWFTTPVIDSYHTIWFELHEDLLSTLGIERSKEEPS
jgi:DNA-binding MarR family transcriptional regulator